MSTFIYYVKPIKEYCAVQAETKDEAIQSIKTLQKIKTPNIMTLEEFKTYLVSKKEWAITCETDKEVTFKRKRRKINWLIFSVLMIPPLTFLAIIYWFFSQGYKEEIKKLKLDGIDQDDVICKIDLERIMKYKTVGEWFEEEKKAGYSIPLPLCHSLESFISKRKSSFNQAFFFLIKNKKVFLRDKIYIYDLSAKHF